MLNSNSNNSGASSYSNQGAPIISKNEQKLAESWHGNITGSMTRKSLLERYAAEKNGRGAIILAHALNLNISSSNVDKKLKCTLLYSMTELAMYSEDEMIRLRARESIKLFLQYGAKIKTEGPSPITLLLQTTGITAKHRVTHKFSEILKAFLDIPEIFDIRDEYNATIAHMFAKYPCGSLALVLNKKPELLNAKQSNERTPLAIAIENSQTENALMLINEFKADTSLIVLSPQTALSTAIYLKNLPVIKALLCQGSPIESQACPILPEDKTILMELSKAGYFLCDKHIMSNEQGGNPLLNQEQEGENACFFTLENENRKEHEHIFNAQQINETKIKPTKDQIKRLHLTFMELLDRSNETGSDPDYANYVNILYNAFKLKFPPAEQITYKRPESPTPEVTDYGPDRLQALVYTASIHPHNKKLLQTVDEEAKKILASPLTTEIKIKELIPIITKFHQVMLLTLNQYVINSESNKLFSNFAVKMLYKFSTKIIPIFLKQADKKQLEEMSSAIITITSLACNYIDNNTNQSGQTMVEVLELIAATFSEKSASIATARNFSMLSCIQKLVIYTDSLLYDAILDCLETMRSLKDVFFKEDVRDSFQRMLWIRFRDLIDIIKITRRDLPVQQLLIETIESMLNDLIKKGATREEQLQVLVKLCKLKIEMIRAEYLVIVTELRKIPKEHYTFGEFTGKYLKIYFNRTDTDDIDIKRLRAKIKKVPNLEIINEVICFNLIGLTQEEINTTVELLNAIKPEEIKVENSEESKPISPASASSDESQSSFAINSEIEVERRHIKKQKNKVPASPATQPLSAIAKRVTQEDIDQIRTGLRVTLNLRENAELFPIDHPAFPASRKHLCFGLWSDITTKKSEIIPAATIQSHHDLALTGKVVSFAYGHNGLKPTKIIDASTGKYVEGLKTKRASDDLRINSAPVKVRLQTKEEVLLYVFGVATDHKQEAPKIDTAALILKSGK